MELVKCMILLRNTLDGEELALHSELIPSFLPSFLLLYFSSISPFLSESLPHVTV